MSVVRHDGNQTGPASNQQLSSHIEVRSVWGDAFRRFMKARLSVIGLVITGVFIILGLIGPLLAPYDYLAQNLNSISQLPSRDHLLGTDGLGRDMLSRILWGAQTALAATAIVSLLAAGIGVVIGSVSAYVGGYVDTFLTWITNVIMTIPALLLAVLVDYVVRAPIANWTEAVYQKTQWEAFSTGAYSNYIVVFASLGFVFWPHFALLVRGQVLSIRQMEYVLAAQAVGVPSRRVIARYLIPNSLGPILVAITLSACDIIVLEAGLSFLGVGIKPPGASWGGMISKNLHVWSYRPHLVFVPAAVLGITAIGLAFLGNGLCDALDPRRSNEH